MVTLQCCVDFCHTATGTSHKNTYTLPFEPSSYPHLSPIPPSRSCRDQTGLPVLHNSFPSAIYFTMLVYVSQYYFPDCSPLRFLLCVYKSVLYICFSILAL